MEYPCHNCQNRHTACHSSCKSYQKAKQKNDEIRTNEAEYTKYRQDIYLSEMARKPVWTYKFRTSLTA